MSEVQAAALDAVIPAPNEGAPAPVPQVNEPKEDPVLAERLSQMARRQKAIYRQQREYQAKSQELAQREAQIKQFEQFREQGRTNPEAFLQQTLGMTYDQLVQWKINGGQVTPEMEVRAIRDDLARRDQEAKQREQQTQQQQEMQRQREQQEVIENWKQEINDLVESDPDTYELINKTQSHDLIADTVEEHWKRSVKQWKMQGSPRDRQPKMLTNKQAAEMVEKYLENQFDDINSSSKKMSSRYAKRDAEQPSSMRDQAREMRSGSPTLSNQIPSSSAPSMLSAANEQDRIARALAKLRPNK